MIRTWFITGASSGFGRQLVELLLLRGDRVAATVRKPDDLEDLAAKYSGQLWVGILDVTDGAAVRHVLDRAFSELLHIDVVVSNAGYALFGAAEEVTDAQIERQFDTNLLGSIWVARAAIPTAGRRPHYPNLIICGSGGLPDDGRLRRHEVGYRGFLRGHHSGNRTVRHRGDSR